MQLNGSNSSTGTLDGYFDGSFKNGLTPQWTLNQSIDKITPEGQTVLLFGQHIAGKSSVHGFRFATSADGPKIPIEIAMRSYCCALVDQLPDESLPEICEALTDIYDFYLSRETQKQFVALKPATQITGEIVRTYERPVFSITGE